jgi:predicted transcriptional regulator
VWRSWKRFDAFLLVDMQDSTITILDERDHEFIQMLRNLGAPRNLAHFVAYLKNVNEATTSEVERGTGLGYTGEATALQALQEMGWIEAREFKRRDW